MPKKASLSVYSFYLLPKYPCHPEGSECFAERSTHGVEWPLRPSCCLPGAGVLLDCEETSSFLSSLSARDDITLLKFLFASNSYSPRSICAFCLAALSE